MKVLIAIAFLGMVNAYLYGRFNSWFKIQGCPSGFLAIVFPLFFAVQLLWPVLDIWMRESGGANIPLGLHDILVNASFIVLGVFSCLIVYTLLADFAGLVARIFLSDQQLIAFIRALIILPLVATAVNVVWGYSNTGKVAVVPVEIAIQNLPPAFEGYKIAQISDTHIGTNIDKDFAQMVVDQVNVLNADMVALTGDWADGFPLERKDAVAPFKRLRAPDGVYYVTGNHEYYWDAVGWENEALQTGFHTLANTHIMLNRGSEKLAIAGVSDPTSLSIPSTPPTNIGAALAGVPAGVPKILLAHQPVVVESAAKLNVDLVLSGHTHAGQYFPYTLIIHLFQKRTKGLYEVGPLQLYINRGTGFWGPPLRTGGLGEITLITLHCK
ncbi:MAG: metallophosphoesterase [Proteobacteria bacterium]|nr:metallophosphoesterase [Alphaproteobacteria bacterium]NCC02584.1 metallophosphoesterase [Pseudomonadota bacterium]